MLMREHVKNSKLFKRKNKISTSLNLTRTKRKNPEIGISKIKNYIRMVKNYFINP